MSGKGPRVRGAAAEKRGRWSLNEDAFSSLEEAGLRLEEAGVTLTWPRSGERRRRLKGLRMGREPTCRECQLFQACESRLSHPVLTLAR